MIAIDIDSSLKRRPKNISKAALGSNVKFSCTARSYPKATYVWYKDGSAVSQTVRRIITETGELVISELRASDVGQYHCIAQNYLGYAKSTFAKLHIDECK
ncbi:uncharacterized protein TRIADDRAFT_19668 [Trichoplax adhaerens]|uniref:Ig-like domain-containing protein n=1 Tax=Trichoplax adhaerens TaxID=10228 RepID=B3RI10_TRIAD|nr:hypothetical protein TRIADDRAFT_19668 [Trichoplax adhaerens]EDV29684.1 hypothetical protein TRIADDRAFT_19668 [Trichoplax adhaerens]|eukprot:XP_002108886.1 hypothetical protein TRIADDRAFT_19668 [Trichoplax adhaerens]